MNANVKICKYNLNPLQVEFSEVLCCSFVTLHTFLRNAGLSALHHESCVESDNTEVLCIFDLVFRNLIKIFKMKMQEVVVVNKQSASLYLCSYSYP